MIQAQGELKRHQTPMTVAEQVENLKNLGLIVPDEDYARATLGSISYYRLIKAYALNLKATNGRFYGQVTFEQIVGLYQFNTDLRHLLFPIIELIEIRLRCRLANYISLQYGALGYQEETIFPNIGYHTKFLEDVAEEVHRNQRAPFVRNFRDNYVGGALPFYALVEIMSFGSLSRFYKNLCGGDKKAIAREFGVGYTYLESWLESLAYVRNVCAHYGRLYNTRLPKRPALYKEYQHAGIDNSRIFAVLLCLRQLMLADPCWNVFVEDLAKLVARYPDVRIGSIGFPGNWIEILKVTA